MYFALMLHEVSPCPYRCLEGQVLVLILVLKDQVLVLVLEGSILVNITGTHTTLAATPVPNPTSTSYNQTYVQHQHRTIRCTDTKRRNHRAIWPTSNKYTTDTRSTKLPKPAVSLPAQNTNLNGSQ